MTIWTLTRLAWAFYWRLQIRLVWLLPVVLITGAVITNVIPESPWRWQVVVVVTVASCFAAALGWIVPSAVRVTLRQRFRNFAIAVIRQGVAGAPELTRGEVFRVAVVTSLIMLADAGLCAFLDSPVLETVVWLVTLPLCSLVALLIDYRSFRFKLIPA